MKGKKESAKPVATVKAATLKSEAAPAATPATEAPVKTTAKKNAEKTTENAKAAEEAVVKKAEEAKKTVEKKAEEAKKTVEKKAAAVKKTVEKKTAAVKKSVAKAAVEESVTIQYSSKSYSTEQLVASAKDIWVYDLQKKEADFKKVELYVKPEENKVYYVINGEEMGSFTI